MYIKWAGSEDSFLFLESQLKKIAEATPEMLKQASDWEEEQDEGSHFMLQMSGDLAIIDVSGCMVKGSMGWWGQYIEVIGYDDIRNAIIAGISNGAKSFLVHLDTPGGMVHGIGALTDFLARVNQTTPINFYTDTFTASAGVWLATTTRKFQASRHAEVGSVGVLQVSTDLTGMFKQMGVSKRVFKSSPLKASGNPNERLDAANADEIQRGVDESAQRFIQHIAEGMGLSIQHVSDNIATGQMWYSETALGLGLINGITSFDELVVDLQNKLSQNSNNSNGQPLNPNVSTYAEEDMSKRKLIQAKTPEEALALAASGISVIEASEITEEDVTDTGEVASGETETPEATVTSAEETPAAAVGLDVVIAKTTEQLIAAKVELAETKAELAVANVRLDKALTHEAGFKSIVAVAIQRAYVAAGSTPPDESSLVSMESSVLLAQHASAESMLAKRFGLGGQVTVAVQEEDAETARAEQYAKYTNDVLVPLVRVSK